MDFVSSAHFLSLFSLVSIWLFDKKQISLILFTLCLVLSFISESLDISAIFIAATFLILNYIFYNSKTSNFTKSYLWFIIFLIAFFLSNHNLPGFQDWQFINGEFISPNAEKFSVFLNIDKILAGFGIAVFGLTPLRNFLHLKKITIRIFPTLTLALITIASFGLITGLAKLDPKFPDIWLVWIMSNLLMNCISEEILFRFFLQGNLQKLTKGLNYSTILSIIFTSCIFTLFHSSESMLYMVGIFIGSCFIGYAYHITKRVEASILLHFIINVIHFFFFTYPMLRHF